MDERERVPCGLVYKLKRVCCGWNRLKKAVGKKKPEISFAWVRSQLIRLEQDQAADLEL
jgi:hypothetical protein